MSIIGHECKKAEKIILRNIYAIFQLIFANLIINMDIINNRLINLGAWTFLKEEKRIAGNFSIVVSPRKNPFPTIAKVSKGKELGFSRKYLEENLISNGN